MFPEIAYAMAPPADQAGQGGGAMSMVIMIVPMIVIFYFLLIRPQSKRAKLQQEFLKNLKKGDEVITSGGIYGKIVGLTDATVIIEVADKVRLRVARSHVSGLQKTSGTQAQDTESTGS